MKPERRSWQFWVWGFVFLFLAHAVAVLQFGERQLPASLREKPRPFFYLSLDEASERRLAESTLGHDPTLFALPSPHGFSGGAWLKFRPEGTRLSNWSAPPEWLRISVEQLGFSLNEFVATNRPSEDQLLASLRATREVDVSLPDEPVIKRTLVTVDGPLGARKLVHAPPLPSAGHNDILKRTIVNVAVNGDGVVESASIFRESGSRTADTNAVELARAFQFDPVPVSTAAERTFAAPVIGRLIFNWHVTNAPPGAPR
jgi:TonB family protein